jgi:cytidylate kinase
MINAISISGDLGSGKSTISNILNKHLNYDYIYTGGIQRQIAEKYNMTTNELNIYAETHPEIDEEIDAVFKSLDKTDNLIIDSRLAWFFIPNSFKVFLKTETVIAAKRISQDTKRKNESYLSLEEAVDKIEKRKESENKRYKNLYGVNCLDMDNYNLVVDTSHILPEEAANIILKEYKLWLQTIPNDKDAVK